MAEPFAAVQTNQLEPKEDESGFSERPGESGLQETMKELVCYLWDNYLEGYESNDIVLMGVGDSYLGIRMLLTSRGSSYHIGHFIFIFSCEQSQAGGRLTPLHTYQASGIGVLQSLKALGVITAA